MVLFLFNIDLSSYRLASGLENVINFQPPFSSSLNRRLLHPSLGPSQTLVFYVLLLYKIPLSLAKTPYDGVGPQDLFLFTFHRYPDLFYYRTPKTVLSKVLLSSLPFFFSTIINLSI